MNSASFGSPYQKRLERVFQTAQSCTVDEMGLGCASTSDADAGKLIDAHCCCTIRAARDAADGEHTGWEQAPIHVYRYANGSPLVCTVRPDCSFKFCIHLTPVPRLLPQDATLEATCAVLHAARHFDWGSLGLSLTPQGSASSDSAPVCTPLGGRGGEVDMLQFSELTIVVDVRSVAPLKFTDMTKRCLDRSGAQGAAIAAALSSALRNLQTKCPVSRPV